MSPKNTVTTLKQFCLSIISNQVIHALSDDERQYYEVVEKYLAGATYEVLQNLLEIILNSLNLDAGIRFSCLQLLLREDVKKLDTGMFPQFYYEEILKTVTSKGKRLQHLNLKGVWARDYPKLLSELIRNLNSLKTLVMPHMANDAVIEHINGLKSLLLLDICGEACYTASGVKKLVNRNIRTLNIGNFGEVNLCRQELGGVELVAYLIEHLPNLSSLRTYSFTGSAIFYLFKQTPSYKTKLKYFHDTGTTCDIIESVINLCPDLEGLHLDSPEAGVLEKLSSLGKLNSLKLTKGNVEELLTFLAKSGSQLQALKLNQGKNYSLDLSEICLHVPNLLTLECFQMKLTFSNLDTYFMSLESVELLYCDMSDHVIRFILANSPFLKRIVVGCIINMTDGDIFRLCAESDFGSLEEIWFSCARWLTATAVELLMGHCPNLKVIGQLSGWDIRQDQLDYLRAVIASTNTNLTLLSTVDFS